MKKETISLIALVSLTALLPPAVLAVKFSAPSPMRGQLRLTHEHLCNARVGMLFATGTEISKVDRAKVLKSGLMKRWISVYDHIVRAELETEQLMKDIGEKP